MSEPTPTRTMNSLLIAGAVTFSSLVADAGVLPGTAQAADGLRTPAIVTTSATSTALAASAAPVTVRARTGGGALSVRRSPTNASGRLHTIRNGTRFRVQCRVSGQKVKGRGRTTTAWLRMASGGYVSDAYVVRPSAVARCAPAVPAPAAAPAPAPAPAPATPAQFLAQVGPSARLSQKETRVPASVTLAQAILESGWGRSDLAVSDRNYFGIKCSSAGHGPYATGCRRHPTTECDSGGCHRTTALFRTYRSPADSFKDHGNFLASSSRYRTAFSHTADPDRFAREIAKAGYATDPAYPAKLIELMRSYDLYRYN
ncbi:sporangiospore maturation cell wall hydrolase GsmA [Planobispora siamensis]|uniref:Mannosyl-glycoprotein endo-beta-N-acetylglucosamidase-like domain-containing protein n=1 Tax=Planobispora siamensis TaxID=936338 RepID=A0A8J3SQV5_9ACTN|nr:sporangiospore maturation cell wall hydrolase GsmA [Planobispora siamensis]GIH97815.1 hypothetical protein Psi01_84450 [Planobispora siamensis]